MAKKKEEKKTVDGPKKDIGVPEPATETMTVELLEKEYPDLIAEIRAQIAVEISNLSAESIKAEMPGLYRRIAADSAGASAANLNEKGFMLSLDDPFAEGTVRTFAHLAKRPGLKVPCVLPFKDPNTKAALQGYIIRAAGGGDIERAGRARKALAKCK